jgi:hypothetical protein
MRRRSPALALTVACAASVMLAARISPAVAGDRIARRAAELALPDPYLDPSWPDTSGDEMKGRYAPGRSDSVEDEPLDEDGEIQEEQRALPELGGETPPGAEGTAAPAPAAVAAPGVAAPGEPESGVEQAPDEPDPDVPQDDVDDVPDLEERDPVEW